MFPLKDNVSTVGFPRVTVGLIVVCSLVFLWQLTLSGEPGTGSSEVAPPIVGGPSERDDFAAANGTSPLRVADAGDDAAFDPGPPWWLSPFTAIGVAPDLLHLAVDLLFLLVFGRTLELRLGPLRLLAIIGVGAAASIGAQALVEPESGDLVVGAGAALAGVLGAYAVLHPRATVLNLSLVPGFGTLIAVPALLMMVAWLAVGLIPAVAPLVATGLLIETGPEYLGYAAAFVVGAAVAKPFSRGRAVDDATLSPA